MLNGDLLFLYIYELGLDDKVVDGKERKGYVCVCVKRIVYFFWCVTAKDWKQI